MSDAGVRVKICGIRSAESALAVAAAGADLLGFNFAPVSRRRVETGVAREAIALCRERSAPPAMAGIFVNQPVDEVVEIAGTCGLDYVQLSGDEDAAYCLAVAAATGLPIVKAVRLSGDGEAERISALVAAGAAAVLLADTAAGGSWGGSGVPWRWQDAAGLAARHPVLLAGGLNADNVAAAVRAVRPWGVDVASGVEAGGSTDPARVRAFVERAKWHGIASATRTFTPRSSVHRPQEHVAADDDQSRREP